VQVLWGNRWPGSFDESALVLARLLGINSTAEFSMEWDHMQTHVHAGADQQTRVHLVRLEGHRRRGHGVK
jgi:hypothetical protein